MKHAAILLMVMVLLASCQIKNNTTIVHLEDYESYLENNGASATTSKYFELWNGKVTKDSTQMMALANVASEYDRFFKNTGNITFLKKAELSLKKAYEVANINKEAYARALARNYISQHRFKEALAIAKAAQKLGGGSNDTKKLLFDVHVELGNYGTAEQYLDSIKNFSDFGYLIRLAKWNDYKGDLDTTIRMMELAKSKADASNNESLKLWSYTNLADYYGHAGRLTDSYTHYLKALKLDPNNAYAKKGIAWILYSHENNPDEALRLLNSITEHYQAPDYYLFKAEVYEYLNDTANAESNRAKYLQLLSDPSYGAMYNTYEIERLLGKNQLQPALDLAQEEVRERPTPESYHLLAMTYLRMGRTMTAKILAEEYLVDKSFEPKVLMTLAAIFKEANEYEKVKPLKKELMGALYELGPLDAEKIKAL